MDHGFLYGDGIYETLQVRQGKVFLLKEHLRRLYRSAKGISLPLPWSQKKITHWVYRTIQLNRHKEAAVRIIATRGPGAFGFDPRTCKKTTLVITSSPFQSYSPQAYDRGIKAAVVSIRRNSPLSLPPTIKSTSCLNGILAKIESIKMKAQEAILLSLDESLSEGSVCNVFLVKKKNVVTPALEGTLLPGVTRGKVLELAKGRRYKVEAKKLYLRDLLAADEIFITSSLMNIMPVSTLVYREAKRGRMRSVRFKVGPLTKDLMAQFRPRPVKTYKKGTP